MHLSRETMVRFDSSGSGIELNGVERVTRSPGYGEKS